MELCSMEPIEVQKKKVQVRRLCIMVPKDKKHILGNLPKNGLVHTQYNSIYQITLCFQ
jgi:hypothetical protein